ncbi:MAG: adenosine kinase [Actinobacteria bacterium]|nr:adenosine kinase [Actinomycetota bacterium]
MSELHAPDVDVVAVGNALVDVLSHESDEFLAAHDRMKGSMTLIEADEAMALYAAMGPGIEISGGSAANTVVGITSFGGTAAFIGRVGDDQLGTVFGHDIRAAGVRFDATPSAGGSGTGRCLVLVTPDGERTLNTFLGAAAEVSPDDVDADLVRSAQVTYLEGYLWDQPAAKEAFRYAARVAHAAGRRVALTLSDRFCVERHRADFMALVDDEVDILFANEAEICALYEVDAFDDALQRVNHHCEVAALTRSAKGSVVVSGDEVHVVDAAPLAGSVVDTTGAGDLYAAGFLFGFTHGYDLGSCARLGSVAAAEVISHLGARPESSLAALAADVLA